ncbi:MAG: hypothetical protein HKN36_13350 [Hellea sp.]|nr:hypothetical protein [Hellea sp.]
MTPFIDERRKPSRIRPIKAIGHMRKLLRDNEDTEQVFHIMDALNGNNMVRKLGAFAKTEKGAACLKRKCELPEILDDHATLKGLPDGTVGRAYVAFMEREGLTAAGLVEESEKWFEGQERFEDDFDFYGRRMRDTHDLLHVLTGYGRDQLGETSVLAFSHAHNGGFGNLFIAYIGARDLAKKAPKSARIMDSVREARKHGRESLPLMPEDIVALLREPLESARKRLNFQVPKAYKAALDELQNSGHLGQLSAA